MQRGKKYKKIIDTRPEEVIEFSIKAILYKENEWAGSWAKRIPGKKRL